MGVVRRSPPPADLEDNPESSLAGILLLVAVVVVVVVATWVRSVRRESPVATGRDVGLDVGEFRRGGEFVPRTE